MQAIPLFLEKKKEATSIGTTGRGLDPKKIPQHVAVIMDGNRRWASQKNLPSSMGHWQGAEVLEEIVEIASQIGIKTLTVYAFSTENKSRNQDEIEALMDIFEFYLHHKRETLVRENTKLDAIGDLDTLPDRVKEALSVTQKATQYCNKINLILALNYGGRDEIRRAMVKILKMNQLKKLSLSDLTEDLIASQLDTAKYGDPDLLIRTSGEIRVSNFLLWQISYAEIYTTDVLWPDFSSEHFLEAIASYQNRERRKGGSL